MTEEEKREKKNRKARERYANNEHVREYHKAKARQATANLDDEGRKKRAEYMREYLKKHPEYVEQKRIAARERYWAKRENKNVQQ